MSLRVVWQKGGEAQIESCDSKAIVLLSSISAPPGTPLSGALPSGTEVQVKVHVCKRQPGDAPLFRIQGRLFNASRKVKDELGV